MNVDQLSQSEHMETGLMPQSKECSLTKAWGHAYMLRIWILGKLEQETTLCSSEEWVINNIKLIWTLIIEGAAGAQTFQNRTPAFAKPAKFKIPF